MAWDKGHYRALQCLSRCFECSERHFKQLNRHEHTITHPQMYTREPRAHTHHTLHFSFSTLPTPIHVLALEAAADTPVGWRAGRRVARGCRRRGPRRLVRARPPLLSRHRVRRGVSVAIVASASVTVVTLCAGVRVTNGRV